MPKNAPVNISKDITAVILRLNSVIKRLDEVDSGDEHKHRGVDDQRRINFAKDVKLAKQAINSIVRRLDWGDLCFLPIEEEEKLDVSKLHAFSKRYNNSPVLIKKGNTFSMYGFLDNQWKITDLRLNEQEQKIFDENINLWSPSRNLPDNVIEILKRGHSHHDNYNYLMHRHCKRAISVIREDSALYPVRKFVESELDYIVKRHSHLSLPKYRQGGQYAFTSLLTWAGGILGFCAQLLLIAALPPIISVPLVVMTFLGVIAVEFGRLHLGINLWPVSLILTPFRLLGEGISHLLGLGFGWALGTMVNMIAQLFPKPELQPLDVESLVPAPAVAVTSMTVISEGLGLSPDQLRSSPLASPRALQAAGNEHAHASSQSMETDLEVPLLSPAPGAQL